MTEAVDVAPRHALDEAARLERADEPESGAPVHAQPRGQLAHGAHLSVILERLEDPKSPIHRLHRVAHDATRR